MPARVNYDGVLLGRRVLLQTRLCVRQYLLCWTSPLVRVGLVVVLLNAAAEPLQRCLSPATGARFKSCSTAVLCSAGKSGNMSTACVQHHSDNSPLNTVLSVSLNQGCYLCCIVVVFFFLPSFLPYTLSAVIVSRWIWLLNGVLYWLWLFNIWPRRHKQGNPGLSVLSAYPSPIWLSLRLPAPYPAFEWSIHW